MSAYNIKSLPLIFGVGLFAVDRVHPFEYAKFNFFNYSEEYDKNKA